MILMHKKDGREHRLSAVFLSIMQIPFYHRMGFGDNVPDKGLGTEFPFRIHRRYRLIAVQSREKIRAPISEKTGNEMHCRNCCFRL